VNSNDMVDAGEKLALGGRSWDRVNILGVWIDDVTMSEAVTWICELVDRGKFSYVVTPNVDHVMKLQRDEEFREIYLGANLVLTDGVPLLWASRILGTPLKERVTGSDLLLRLCAAAARKGCAIFLLGGNSGVARDACSILKTRYNSLNVAGYYCPESGFEKNAEECLRIQKIIADSKADILFVGLGTPKQEKWIKHYGSGCQVPVAIGVGASFSFVTGELRRAPRWMQKSGLECTWRLLCEPRRLWKRYILDDMPFLWLVAKAWVMKRAAKTQLLFSTPLRRRVHFYRRGSGSSQSCAIRYRERDLIGPRTGIGTSDRHPSRRAAMT